MDRSSKKRKQEEEEEARRLSNALQSFEADFGSAISAPSSKAFIRGDVVENNRKVSEAPTEKKLYKPEPTLPIKIGLPSIGNSFEEAKRLAAEKARRMLADAHRGSGPVPIVVAPTASKPVQRPQRPGAKKDVKSKTSNLDAFKEELKRVQEEREKRKGLRDHLQNELGVDSANIDRIAPSLEKPYLGGGEYDDDPFTTNLYICNLPLDITMEDLYESFGSFGPLASAKILYPRTEEEKRRDHLCGFVAFMHRADTDRAVTALSNNLEIRCEPIKIAPARPVVIPPIPVYVPAILDALSVPDPPTGLPFNAKPLQNDIDEYMDDYKELPLLNQPLPEDMPGNQRLCYMKMIKNATVRVVIPTDSHLLHLIHRTIEFVVREGPIFEAMIMGREQHNPIFRFLFDNHHPAHVYYRWKLFSVLQGDDLHRWRMEKFRLFVNGSWWEPPPPFGELFKAMPKSLYFTSCNLIEPEKWFPARLKKKEEPRKRRHDDSVDEHKENTEKKKRNTLIRAERNQLEEILRNLTPEKDKVGDAMVWCAEHASCAQEICETVYESLTIDETPLHKKIARVYLISDILANCAQRGVKDIFFFRQYFEVLMEKIFDALGETLRGIVARLKAEQFKQRIMLCFRAWEEHAIYPNEFLIHNQNVFLGLVKRHRSASSSDSSSSEEDEENIDGAPIDEDDIDGIPLEVLSKNEQAELLMGYEDEPPKKKSAGFKVASWSDVTESAGPDGSASKSSASKWEGSGSKWDDDEIPARSQTAEKTSPLTSKTMSTLVSYAGESVGSSDTDGEIESPGQLAANAAYEEERRKFMREIELKVMSYQDDLEGKERSDVIKRKVDEYRKKEMTDLENVINGRLNRDKKKDKKKDKEKKKEKKEDKRSRSKDMDRRKEREERSRDKERDRTKQDSSRDRDRVDRREKDRHRDRERNERNRRSRSNSRDRDRDRRGDRSSDRRRSRSLDRRRR